MSYQVVEVDPLAPRPSDIQSNSSVILHVKPDLILDDSGISSGFNNLHPGHETKSSIVKKKKCRKLKLIKRKNIVASCEKPDSNDVILKDCHVLLNRIDLSPGCTYDKRNELDCARHQTSKKLSKLKKRLRDEKKTTIQVHKTDVTSNSDLIPYLKQCRVLLERINFPLQDTVDTISQRSTRSRGVISIVDSSPKISIKLVKLRTSDLNASPGNSVSSDEQATTNVVEVRRYSLEPCGENSLKFKIKRTDCNTDEDISRDTGQIASPKFCFPVIKMSHPKSSRFKQRTNSKKALLKNSLKTLPLHMKQCTVVLKRISLPIEGGSKCYTEDEEGTMLLDKGPRDSCLTSVTPLHFKKKLDENDKNLSQVTDVQPNEGISISLSSDDCISAIGASEVPFSELPRAYALNYDLIMSDELSHVENKSPPPVFRLNRHKLLSNCKNIILSVIEKSSSCKVGDCLLNQEPKNQVNFESNQTSHSLGTIDASSDSRNHDQDRVNKTMNQVSRPEVTESLESKTFDDSTSPSSSVESTGNHYNFSKDNNCPSLCYNPLDINYMGTRNSNAIENIQIQTPEPAVYSDISTKVICDRIEDGYFLVSNNSVTDTTETEEAFLEKKPNINLTGNSEVVKEEFSNKSFPSKLNNSFQSKTNYFGSKCMAETCTESVNNNYLSDKCDCASNDKIKNFCFNRGGVRSYTENNSFYSSPRLKETLPYSSESSCITENNCHFGANSFSETLFNKVEINCVDSSNSMNTNQINQTFSDSFIDMCTVGNIDHAARNSINEPLPYTSEGTLVPSTKHFINGCGAESLSYPITNTTEESFSFKVNDNINMVGNNPNNLDGFKETFSRMKNTGFNECNEYFHTNSSLELPSNQLNNSLLSAPVGCEVPATSSSFTFPSYNINSGYGYPNQIGVSSYCSLGYNALLNKSTCYNSYGNMFSNFENYCSSGKILPM